MNEQKKRTAYSSKWNSGKSNFKQLQLRPRRPWLCQGSRCLFQDRLWRISTKRLSTTENNNEIIETIRIQLLNIQK